MSDICELSSLVKSHDIKKEFIGKKLLTLNAALQQQNQRVSK